MEIVTGLILLLLGAVLAIAILLTRARVKASRPRRVDEYVLSVEERDGFQLVQMKMKTDDGRVSTFELEPTYGHVLSDELCTTAAHAMKAKARADHAAQ